MKEFPIRTKYIKPVCNKIGGERVLSSDPDEVKLQKMFQDDGYYKIHINEADFQLWNVQSVYGKQTSSVGKRKVKYIAQNTKGYEELLENAECIYLENVKTQFRSKGYECGIQTGLSAVPNEVTTVESSEVPTSEPTDLAKNEQTKPTDLQTNELVNILDVIEEKGNIESDFLSQEVYLPNAENSQLPETKMQDMLSRERELQEKEASIAKEKELHEAKMREHELQVALREKEIRIREDAIEKEKQKQEKEFVEREKAIQMEKDMQMQKHVQIEKDIQIQRDIQMTMTKEKEVQEQEIMEMKLAEVQLMETMQVCQASTNTEQVHACKDSENTECVYQASKNKEKELQIHVSENGVNTETHGTNTPREAALASNTEKTPEEYTDNVEQMCPVAAPEIQAELKVEDILVDKPMDNPNKSHTIADEKFSLHVIQSVGNIASDVSKIAASIEGRLDRLHVRLKHVQKSAHTLSLHQNTNYLLLYILKNSSEACDCVSNLYFSPMFDVF